MIENILAEQITDNQKIDKLLELDCNMYTNLGTDSTKTEKQEVKRMSKKYIKQYRPSMSLLVSLYYKLWTNENIE